MEINRQLVTLEQANLLKLIGFHVSCDYYYSVSLSDRPNSDGGYSGPHAWKKGEINITSGYFVNNFPSIDWSNADWIAYAAPEYWLVVEWLRIKHDIWIEVRKDYDSGILLGYESQVDCEDGYIDCGTYKTPQKAYSKALSYVLNYLISR